MRTVKFRAIAALTVAWLSAGGSAWAIQNSLIPNSTGNVAPALATAGSGSEAPVVMRTACACPAPCDDACASGCAADCATDCSLCDSCAGCDGGCSSCGSGLGLGLGDTLKNILVPGDKCFPCLLSPMTNPVYFEDPRTLTEARLIYLNHSVPVAAGGNDVNLVACQLRAALTKRLSIIATKDGFITSTNPLIDDGWANINAGLKYNLIADPSSPLIVSAGATYEMPVGSRRALQGNGDGLYHLFATGGTRIGAWNWLLADGLVLASDPSANSSFTYLSTHLSRRLGTSNLYWLTEFNWYHWLDAGTGGIAGVEGGDLFNLGSSGVAGNDIVTGAFGFKYKPRQNIEAGIAWENPLTARRDVLDNRITADLILRY